MELVSCISSNQCIFNIFIFYRDLSHYMQILNRFIQEIFILEYATVGIDQFVVLLELKLICSIVKVMIITGTLGDNFCTQ